MQVFLQPRVACLCRCVMARVVLILLPTLVLLAGCATQPAHPQQPVQTVAGPYPIENGIRATVEGTPGAWRAALPQNVPISVRSLDPLVQRKVPAVLRYAVPLQYTVALQPVAAPLVFVIAGTGAAANSAKCRLLLRMIYSVGSSAICLPSPTTVTFMAGAESRPMPGYMPNDVGALYAMMRAIKEKISTGYQVTSYALAGYSLGGTEAAFLAHLDARKEVFSFSKVLLINPSVDLWGSVQRMDDLLDNNLPGGISGIPAFLASLLGNLQKPYDGQTTGLRFNSALLFRSQLVGSASNSELSAVVGLVFRLALANMAFAADVLTHAGVIVPDNVQLSVASSLAPYLLKSFNLTFSDYVNQLLLPYWNRDGRQLTRTQLFASGNLRSIRAFLANSSSMAVITNADDPILGADDLTFLRRTFGVRAHIFPRGGHMGNLAYMRVVHTIQRFFSR